MKKNIKLIPIFVASLLVTACGGDNKIANAPTPTMPDDYQDESTNEIERLVAHYDFEGSLADASSMSPDAEVVGHTTEATGLGNIQFDMHDGIHALSASAVFDEISGLLLPGNILSYSSYTVSMWVKPEAGNTGTLFFAKSDRGSLLLNHEGLTISGMTGQGTNGDEVVIYTSDEFIIPAALWSHIVFTVDEGLVDMYINGERVYEAGDLTDDGFTFEDGFQMETDDFTDLFSGTINTVAIGVTDSEEDQPFAGQIDNLRIYDYALYYGNVTVLSREVSHEGPFASVSTNFADPEVILAWTIERFNPDFISISREAFAANETVVLAEGENALPGTTTEYSDTEVPAGDDYRYTLIASDAEGHVYTTEPTGYVRVPGSEPYAAVTATLNEQTENIELSLYSENITVGSYDILRDIDNNIADAFVIATGVTATSYINLKDDEDFPLADGTPYYYWVSVTDATTTEVTTSLALPTASATAAGEYIPPGTYVLEELTNGFCGVDGTIDNNNAGFSGAGFANTNNAQSTAIRWRVNVAEETTYNLYVGYANGAGDNRWGILTANGGELVNPVDLPPSGAWTTWVEVKHVITLPAGDTNLTLIAQAAGGLANVDYLKFEALNGGDSPTGVPCAE